MKSKRSFLYFTLPVLLVVSQTNLHSQADLYDFPKIEDEIKVSRQKKVRPSDPFLAILSKALGAPLGWMEKYFAMGVGRSDLIRLNLISKKSGKSLEEITQEYEKESSLKKIALSHNLDYSLLRKESSKILKLAQVQFELERKRNLEPPPTAGVAERTSKE